uniref:TSA: Wollemia nobilis Ref_Wollemi_Transcript_7708_773 transcribed RNA sequence n=1 Tax=Wollemia nobilis TaxID=56998 RepID=A0A0C9QV01_9CONI
MTGSGIFNSENVNTASNSANDNCTQDQSASKLYQQAAGIISQISFNADESVSPKKPTSLTEVAKQKELSGNLETTPDTFVRRQVSEAKSRELTGHDIFGPPSEVPPRSLNRNRERKEEPKEINEPAHRNVRTSVKVSNPAGGHSNIIFGQETKPKTAKKVHDQKVAELTGNNIFKGDPAPNSAEKPLSRAKLREMSGSDIFADGKAESRDCLGGVRKPPGGESSISLV